MKESMQPISREKEKRKEKIKTTKGKIKGEHNERICCAFWSRFAFRSDDWFCCRHVDV
jgi:hypothetical protein